MLQEIPVQLDSFISFKKGLILSYILNKEPSWNNIFQ